MQNNSFIVIGCIPPGLHSDIQYDSDHKIEAKQRSKTVTDKRQSLSGIRHKPGRNADINDTLEADPGSGSAADQPAGLILRSHTDENTFKYDQN